MRGQLVEALIGFVVLEGHAGNVERAGTGVLQPAASLRQGVDDEQVAVEGEAAEERAGSVHDASQSGQQARNVGVGGAGNGHFEARAALAKSV